MLPKKDDGALLDKIIEAEVASQVANLEKINSDGINRLREIYAQSADQIKQSMEPELTKLKLKCVELSKLQEKFENGGDIEDLLYHQRRALFEDLLRTLQNALRVALDSQKRRLEQAIQERNRDFQQMIEDLRAVFLRFPI